MLGLPEAGGLPVAGAFATAADNLWLIGESGYVLQWTGAAWRQHVLPAPPFRASRNLSAIAGRGPTNMWIAGGNLLYQWDGARWTLRDTIEPGVDQAFHELWVAPNSDV